MGFLDDVTGLAIQRSLDTAALRQRVIAHNIANVDTPGFKRSTVLFEDALSAALGGEGDPDERARRIAATSPQVERIETSSRLDGNNVDIDMEAAELAENALRYEALSRLAIARGRLLRAAISEGRR